MAWSYIRFAIFGCAFLAGSSLPGYLQHWYGTPADSSGIPRLRETAGTALIIACDQGEVQVSHVQSATGSVQLNCIDGRMLVVRDAPQQPRPGRYPAAWHP
jgi:hypothetical protein